MSLRPSCMKRGIHPHCSWEASKISTQPTNRGASAMKTADYRAWEEPDVLQARASSRLD